MFTGDLERKTYADLDAFLAEGLPEWTRLDYKREMPDRIERTISAMANSEGGLIVIGVDEERATRKPKLPPAGIALAGQAERVQSKAYQAIHEPITALDIGTYPFPNDGERGVLVVRVHPSERAPHAVDQGRTVLRRVGAQAMKEGDDLDDRMDVDRMGWLFKRRERPRQRIDKALERYESLLLSKPLPDGHCRFDIVAYPAVAHADTLTVRDLWALMSLRNQRREQFHFPFLRVVSGGLMSGPESRQDFPAYYFDITGLTACTSTWQIEEKLGKPRIYGRWWYEQSQRLLEWVGLASRESGRGGSIHVRARLLGVLDTRIVLNEPIMDDKYIAGDLSLDNEVTAEVTASVDELASDPGPCAAQLWIGLAEAFGREISRDDMLSLLRPGG